MYDTPNTMCSRVTLAAAAVAVEVVANESIFCLSSFEVLEKKAS